MRKGTKKAGILAGAMLITAVLAGCGDTKEAVSETTTEMVTTEVAETTETTTTEVVTTEEEIVLNTIGMESVSAYCVTVINKTGKGIVGVSVMNSESGQYGDNLLAENDIFAGGETRLFYCEKAEEPADSETDFGGDDKLMPVVYDVKIVLEDESEYVLHAFPFDYDGEISMYVGEEIAYIEYDATSTKEAEQYLLEEAKAAAQKAAPAPAPAPAPSNQDSESCIGDEGLLY